jgi:hypothetical protein
MAHRVRRQGALACSSHSGVRPTWTSISSPMSTSLHKPAERCRGGAPLALFGVPYDRLILERSKAAVTTRLLRAAALASNTDGTAVWPHPPVELVTIPPTGFELRRPHEPCPRRALRIGPPAVSHGQRRTATLPAEPPSSRERAARRCFPSSRVPVEEEPFCNQVANGPSPPDSRASLPRPCVTRGSSLVVGWGCAGRRTVPVRRPRRARPGRRGAHPAVPAG